MFGPDVKKIFMLHHTIDSYFVLVPFCVPEFQTSFVL